jgi:CRISPR-associated protein Cas6/Cse3/CasE subtype I-E
MTVTFGTSLATGTLRVDDAELFHQTVTGGIGRNRGYGCGLLLLGPHT